MRHLLPCPLHALLALATTAAPAVAQDLIAVDFAGVVHVLDSRDGSSVAVAAPTASMPNAMARKDGNLWIHESTGPTAIRQHHLSRVDEQNGTVQRIHSNTGLDLRGLATSGTFGRVVGVVNGSPSDTLVEINLANGSATTIGATGFAALQALTLRQGQFLAWDLTHGLVRIDHLTGAGTDVNPSVGTGNAAIQFLVAMEDGRLLGGQSALYEIDPATGVTTLLGSGGYSDLRGAEERFGWVRNFGTACLATNGFADLTVAGSPLPGNTIQAQSIRHAANVPGIQCIGLSTTNAGPTPLPFDVDPLLGTRSCTVWQSCDITLFALANPQGRLLFPIQIPGNLRGATFHVQHAALENVPGGWSFSNATTVRTGL